MKNLNPSPPVRSAEQLAADRHAATLREQKQLRDAQNANALANKLEKLARKDPHIRGLLAEHRAAQATVTALRDKLATAEAAAADGVQAVEDLANLQDEMSTLRGALGQAQKDLGARAVAIEAAQAEVVKLTEQLAKERAALDAETAAHVAERAKLREQLAQALKPKK